MAYGLPSVRFSLPVHWYWPSLIERHSLPESWSGAFDRVISIEMLEAVG